MKHYWRPRSCWKTGLLLLVLVVFLPYGFSRLASPWRCVGVYSSPAVVSQSSRTTDGSIRIVCYNIAHGRGLAGSNWDSGSKEERLDRLDQIAELLRDQDADVVVLNEVDFDSSWSHGVNQAEYLAKKAGYPYRAEQRNLDFRILFWKWRFGNAVLSRYPIENAQVIRFPGFAGWETVLAGKKQGLLCTIDSPGVRFRIAAAHLSHRDESVRAQSARAMVDLAEKSNDPFLIAGDLNSTPPGFPGSQQDHDNNNAVALLDKSANFQRLPEEPPEADQMTFSSISPRVVIDWILIPTAWRFKNYQVIFSELSDHRPIVAEVSDELPDSL